MIRIVLKVQQRGLITDLRELFPDLYLDNLTDENTTYIGSFGEGAARLRQQQFLYTHKIGYTDIAVEQQRNLLIQSFFNGVELEGNPITSIYVRSILSTLNYHAASLRTDKNDATVLRFPPSWNPMMFRQDNDYLGWFCVTEGVQDGEHSYEAALIGHEQRPIEIIKRTSTPERMLTWLEDGGLTQVLCTTLAPSVCGLYRVAGPPYA